jgi:pyruvate/2-oxoglutarate dehydrogenase complex dihydrolipoamide acyltransferase (E2) component
MDGHKLTVTAFILKAAAIAQRSHPVSRTFYLPGRRLVTYEEVVAGFTVERLVDNEPIVFFGEIEHADDKPLTALADELKEYCDGDMMSVPKLKEQIQFARMPWLVRQVVWSLGYWFPALRLLCMKATFGLSSLGALGVSFVCGPSVCTSVFGVGEVEERVVVRNGDLAVRPIMTLSLSFDQRVMDGAQAARFLRDVRLLLEGGLEQHLGL